MSQNTEEPHDCGHCHACKDELRNAKQGAAQMCPNLDCERVFIEAYRNLHGQDESPYQGRCPQVQR